MIRLARSYVGFPADPEGCRERKNGTRARCWVVRPLTEVSEGRLAQETQVQTLQNVKRWVGSTLTPMLAVVVPPWREEWLQHAK